MEKIRYHSPIVSLSISFTAIGSSVDNISLCEDSGFTHFRKIGFAPSRRPAGKYCDMDQIPDVALNGKKKCYSALFGDSLQPLSEYRVL